MPPFRLDLTSVQTVPANGFLEGLVTFMTPKSVALKRIYLRIYGRESVSWVEEESDMDMSFHGETTLVNKWYHGWENTQDTIDSGFYSWKFRIRIPENLPPTFESAIGRITYKVYAYLDHDKYTEGIPLRITNPITKIEQEDFSVVKHNMDVRCTFDNPVLFKDNHPLTLIINCIVKNYSDYAIKKFKVQLYEHSVYAANNRVFTSKRLLFSKYYKDNKISGHSEWQGKFITDFPTNYKRISMSPKIGTTRITISHHAVVIVYKDTRLIENKVKLELPVFISTKPANTQDKKQLISLMKGLTVTTPPTPAPKRKEELGPPPKTGIVIPKLAVENVFINIEDLKPVPNSLIDFDSAPIPTTFTPRGEADMTPQSSFHNFGSPNPFV